MLDRTIVSVHKTHLIGFVECPDIDAGMIVEMRYEVGIFNYQHPVCPATVYEIIGQTKLIGACELILSISAELAVIRRVKKHKVIGSRLMSLEKIFEIKV